MSGLCVYGDGNPRRPNSPLCVSHGKQYDRQYAAIVKEGAEIAGRRFAGRRTDEELVDEVVMFGANAGINIRIEDARAALGIERGNVVPFPGAGVTS